MLFNILKLFGLDVPAKIEAARASLELRLQHAADHVKQEARHAAVIAVLWLFAAVAGAMAFGMGLVALYWWTADAYGPYVGLAVVAGVLVAAAIALATVAALKANSPASSGSETLHPLTAGLPSDSVAAAGALEAAEGTMKAAEARPVAPTWAPANATQTAAAASASELVEPLAFVLSKVVKYPSIGNPVIDELVGNLRMSAQGATSEAIEHAADVVRNGDRANLVFVLAGSAFIGWLLAHHSRQGS
jgi:hypothetical protein